MSNKNDEATDDISLLANEEYKKEIVEFIKTCNAPFSIGLSGRWGSGKTSIMKSIKKDLDILENSKAVIKTIWFNPWENETHKEPMVLLLQNIMKNISLWQQTKQEVSKLTQVALGASFDTFKEIINLTTIQKHGNEYEYDNFQYKDRNDSFNVLFQKAIKLCLHNQTKDLTVHKESRLIVFVDDLDRCEDDTVIKLLSSIKKHLSTKYCVFVFGYDRHHIEKSLSKSTNKTQKEAKMYLEKLFQNTFYIKPPTDKQIKDFIKTSLELDSENGILEYISEFMPHNPREVKLYIRALNFEYKTKQTNKTERTKQANEAEQTTQIEQLKGLILITYLKTFYESSYVVILNSPDTIQDLCKVFKEKDISKNENQREYYFYLELQSHINDVDTKIDDYGTKKDKPFLSEVYTMQGKHKQFNNYMTKFSKFFSEANTNIEDYL